MNSDEYADYNIPCANGKELTPVVIQRDACKMTLIRYYCLTMPIGHVYPMATGCYGTKH